MNDFLRCVAVTVLIVFSGAAASAAPGPDAAETMMQESLAPQSCPEGNAIDTAGRGCCSHHNGQCGCAGGRVTCCDGTTSPSCRCLKDDVVDELAPRV